MGRKLNLSTPTVINTETIPLDESFYIVANGQTEQWFYDNNSQYSPNRKLTPLTLTPTLSVVDNDTHTAYTPTFYTVRWFVNEYSTQASDYVETEITAVADGEIDYFKSGNNLVVKKNVSYTRGVTVRCEATYIDPRDSGITYTVSDSVVLSTNRDAEIVYPTLDINAPTSRAYNPLTDSTVDNGVVSTNSRFTFPAKAEWPNDTVMQDVAVCRADNLGTEEIIPQNEESVVTCSPYLDMRYGDVPQTDQTFMYRQTGGGSLSTIDGGKSYIDAVRGKTVKWNQIIGTNFSTWSGSASNISVSINGAKCTVTNNSYEGTSGDAIAIAQSVPTFPSGHKFIVFTDFKKIVGQDIEDPRYEGVIPVTTMTQYRGSIYYLMGTSTRVFGTVYMKVSGTKHAGDSWSFANTMLFDLTSMFGAGNEPDTVADFESWLAVNVGYKDYYPYDAGSLVPVKMTAFKSVGFNLWDGTTIGTGYYKNTGTVSPSSNFYRSDFIPVLPSTRYYLKGTGCSNASFCCYDINKNFITGEAYNNRSATIVNTPANARYLKVSIPVENLNSFCVNLFDASRNGTYEAHYEDIAALDVTTITGKLNGSGNSVTIFPDGMKRVGNVYDEIKVVDGVVKAIKRVGSVDLGTLNWSRHTTRNFFRATGPSKLKAPSSNFTIIKGICSKYVVRTSSQTESTNNSIGVPGNSTVIYVKDDSFDYDNPSAFRTAVSGEYLFFELTTPEEYVIDPQSIPRNAIFEWYGIANNTEVKADTLPWYVSGQGTDILTVDSMYGENITVVLRARDRTTGNLYPNKVYRSVQWRTPDVDTHVVCKNGSAVRSNTQSMEFATVVNVNGRILDEAIKAEHLRFNWKTRKSTSQTETDMGWGLTKTIQASDLRNVRGATSSLSSTLVFPYVYLLGAYEPVERDGQTVYERSVN